MSMIRTKEHLKRILADSESKVLALSGKWGTGKSHMWTSLREESDDTAVEAALYVSLFGVTSIADLKMKLAQAAAMPLLKNNGAGMDALASSLRAAKQVGKAFFPGLSALDEVALLAVPALVKGKFIVLDDIERKHEKLVIDEVLGFIDDFTQNYACRILLILNTDQLADKSVWEKLREKVVDDELRLETTPAEAFDIAIELSPSPYAAQIKPAVEGCGLTNIRIIRKVIRASNRILAGHEPVSADILSRIVPSTVLLAAIHYKGIEDGPTIAFILKLESSVAFTLRERHQRDETEAAENKLHARWRLMLESLGITDTGEYEKLVADYLSSGLVDRSKLDTIIERYCRETQSAGAQSRCRQFFQSTIWNPDLQDDQVIESGRTLLTDLPYLSCYSVTALHDYLAKLEGGAALGEQMVTLWIEGLRAKAAEPDADAGEFILNNYASQPVHPLIVAALEDAYARTHKGKTLEEVSAHIMRYHAWGHAESAIMQAATVDQFKNTILGLQGEALKLFLLQNVDMYTHRATYSEHFGHAPVHFLKACKKIQIERAGTRWVSLIQDLFDDSKVGDDLRQPEPDAAELNRPGFGGSFNQPVHGDTADIAKQ